jgi:hypothetical protein
LGSEEASGRTEETLQHRTTGTQSTLPAGSEWRLASSRWRRHKLRIETCGISGGRCAHAAVSRRPPIPLSTIVARTHMYPPAAKFWDFSTVQSAIFCRAVPNPKRYDSQLCRRCTRVVRTGWRGGCRARSLQAHHTHPHHAETLWSDDERTACEGLRVFIRSPSSEKTWLPMRYDVEVQNPASCTRPVRASALYLYRSETRRTSGCGCGPEGLLWSRPMWVRGVAPTRDI